MAKNQDPERLSFSASTVPPPARPSLTLPPRPSMETFFSEGAGASPGPLTLVSRFFDNTNPDSDYRSFTQLLAGAIASPLARPSFNFENSFDNYGKGGDGRDKDSSGFKQSRPMNLAVGANSPLFMVPSGLSPSGLLNSPGFFSPQSPFGMSHQQALAQVTAQAAFAAQSQFPMQLEYKPSLVSTAASTEAHTQSIEPSYIKSEVSQQQQQAVPSTSEQMESSGPSHSDKKYHAPPPPPPTAVNDKPGDDGFNWRKYGQKQVKGSEFPRSYYKCTYSNCPVKKKVERSQDGQITEIIYKGMHSHEMPQSSNKRVKDSSSSDANGHGNVHVKSEMNSQNRNGGGNLQRSNETGQSQLGYERDRESAQGVLVQVPGSSDSEEVVDADVREDEGNADEPNAKRRNIEVGTSEVSLSHKTVTEPKIIVQTRSEVDLLDDGYRWRKYGQKVVKGNPHPRSYYKCTSAGCNVRKHVERASTDPKAVITTYEGKHNHDVPAARNSSHSTANNNNPHS
uniref:WRKY domain-containing protein n=1 Tax=Cannabis sativa TaxID=3483 RepID=A0A803QMK1_CANSA